VQRLNQRADGFVPLLAVLQAELPQTGVLPHVRLLDSMPIRMAHAKRSRRARVAEEFANKGYCASKGEYYDGVKVPILGLRRPGTVPLREHGLSMRLESTVVSRPLLVHVFGRLAAAFWLLTEAKRA
jgi:hypothetical protein